MSLKKLVWLDNQEYRPVTHKEIINNPALKYEVAFIIPQNYNTKIDLTLDSRAGGITWISSGILKGYSAWFKEIANNGRIRTKKTLEAQPMKVNKEQYATLTNSDVNIGPCKYQGNGKEIVIKIKFPPNVDKVNLLFKRAGLLPKKKDPIKNSINNLHGIFTIEGKYGWQITNWNKPIPGNHPLYELKNNKLVLKNKGFTPPKEQKSKIIKEFQKPYNKLICIQSPNGKCYRIPYSKAEKIRERFKDWTITSKSYYKKWKKEQLPVGASEFTPISDSLPRKFRKAQREQNRQHRSQTDVQKVKVKKTIEQKFLLESGQQLSLKTVNQEWFDVNFPEYAGHKFEVRKHPVWILNKNGEPTKTNKTHHESLWVIVPKIVIKYKTIRVPKQLQVYKQHPNSKRILKKKRNFSPVTRYVIRNGEKVEFTTYKLNQKAA